MRRKICVATGSRAEYGLLSGLMKKIQACSDFELQILVTGMHLSPEFGLTYQEIERDNFKINKKVEMLLSSDSPTGTVKSVGLGMIGIADAFEDLQPDLIIVLGDRYEMLSVATAALIAQIPLAHIHGGETTEGAFDESIRHSITKMSQLHFVAAEPYRKRVIQLGEQPSSVFNVGALGLDAIKQTELHDRSTLEEILQLKFQEKNLLVTFHPVTLEEGGSSNQMKALLEALSTLDDTLLIFTLPNADPEGRLFIEMIKSFCARYSNAKYFASLGHKNYFSCIQYVDGVIGNSSSGVIEVPAFKKGTINIGSRQDGRLKARSVIDCDASYQAVKKAICRLYSPAYQHELRNLINPYGDGCSSDKVINILHERLCNIKMKKKFYDCEGVLRT